MHRMLLAAALAFAPVSLAHEGAGHHHHTQESRAQTERVVVGWGEHAFATVPGWCQVPEGEHLGPTHGSAAVDNDGNVYVTLNSDRFGFGIAVYNADGELLKGIGEQVVGLHSLQYREEDGVGYLYGAQTKRKRAVKLTLDGNLVWEIGLPEQSGKYESADQYKPTSVTVGPDGDVYIADGYGQNWIHQYDSERNYIRSFGGRGEGEGQFVTCHGVAIDPRGDAPRLLVCDRENRRLQYFDLEGNFLSLSTTGLYRPCAVDFHGDTAAVVELAGRAVILDKDNNIVSVLGDNPNDRYRANYRVDPKDWREGIFNAPHGLAFDNDGNLIIEEWNQWGRVAFLQRIKPEQAPQAPAADAFSADPEKFGGWISRDAEVTVSSASQWDRSEDRQGFASAMLPQFAAGFAFHTEREAGPWVQVDLGAVREVAAIAIWNREESAVTLGRAVGMKLYASTDGEQWTELWQAEEALASWEIELASPTRARHLRIVGGDGETPTYLHLRHMRVYGE